ncbi:lipid II flippase family protein [Acinetobacter sp. YH12027]|uniref:lipid II flippase family protein n=1 Tax=Acinetobacter sp. YH12027 TaxID=2601043 RepID=UPI0015D35A57|nr:DUF2837 family protein [Acinetobacter sp. YH12027]
MDYKFLILVVIICFSCIQLIEVLSFIARISGVKENKKSLAYSLQNAVFMLTRLFTLALMPLLGFLVDHGINKQDYLIMVSMALIFGSLMGFSVYFLRNRVVNVFSEVINKIAKGGGVFRQIVLLPFYFIKSKGIEEKYKIILYKDIFLSSAVVFGIYSLSVFIVFYIALFFPDYRTTITQMSGVTNAFATIFLTFFIEPKISRAIDSNDDIGVGTNMLFSLILGRILGVGLLGGVLLVLVIL